MLPYLRLESRVRASSPVDVLKAKSSHVVYPLQELTVKEFCFFIGKDNVGKGLHHVWAWVQEDVGLFKES